MEFDKRQPIYQQVKAYVKQQIAAGHYKPGQELQSRRDIAKNLKINPNTVQRAFKELEEEALIVTDPNVPSRVTTDLQHIQRLRDTLLQDAIQTFYESIAPLQVDSAKLLDQLKTYIDSQRGDLND